MISPHFLCPEEMPDYNLRAIVLQGKAFNYSAYYFFFRNLYNIILYSYLFSKIILLESSRPKFRNVDQNFQKTGGLDSTCFVSYALTPALHK